MANKRTLKKEINYIFDELFAEVLFNMTISDNIDEQKATLLLGRISTSQEDLLTRVSHVDGKDDAKLTKKHFQKLNADLDKELSEISAEIATLSQK